MAAQYGRTTSGIPGSPGNDPARNNSSELSSIPEGWSFAGGVYEYLDWISLTWDIYYDELVPDVRAHTCRLRYDTCGLVRILMYKLTGARKRCVSDVFYEPEQ